MSENGPSKYQELLEQAQALMKQAEELRLQEKRDAIAKIKQLISAYDISASELGYTVNPSKARASRGKPKYHGPGGETWTGVGRQPAWVKAALAEGKSLQDLSL